MSDCLPRPRRKYMKVPFVCSHGDLWRAVKKMRYRTAVDEFGPMQVYYFRKEWELIA